MALAELKFGIRFWFAANDERYKQQQINKNFLLDTYSEAKLTPDDSKSETPHITMANLDMYTK